MSHTADYVNNETSVLAKEKKTLLADIEKLRKQRKDEKRFLDIDAETKKLVEIQDQIAAAVKAGNAEAVRIKKDVDTYSAQAIARNVAASDAAGKQITAEWDKLEVELKKLRTEGKKLQERVDAVVLAEQVLAEREIAAGRREEKLASVLKTHKENLDNV